MKSDDLDYEEINELQNMLVSIENPSIVSGNIEDDLPDSEKLAVKQTIVDALDELLEFQKLPFNDYLKKIVKGSKCD